MVSAPSSDLPSLSTALPPASAEQEYLSVSQAAELFGVSRVSVWRWIRSGHLPATQVGPRTTRINRRDLERLVAERGTTSPWSWVYRRPESRAAVTDTAVAFPQADWTAVGTTEHFVQFYDTDGPLVGAVSGYMGASLRAGDVGIVIATASHREGIEQGLWQDGLDVDEARACGQYVALDASELLSSFMVDGEPDSGRFAATMERILAPALQNGRRVRAFGEMVALLALEGNHDAALRLEQLWNDLQTRFSFALFCAYPMACLSGSALSGALGDVCARHGRVIPSESYTALPTPDDRLRAVVQWQQKAQALEATLAAELAARQAVEDALRVREEFLSIASHELRTPLTTLSGHAQMALRQLQRDPQLEPERLARSLEMIGKQAGKLARLISQLMDVTRLEAGKPILLERAPTDLGDLVKGVAAAAQVLSDRHTISVSAPHPVEIDIDPLRIEQVLTNLLENAIKYSPDGGQIELALYREGPDLVEISVRDHGPGIPVEKRERLFERFYQAHVESNQSGMGLGLYISRQIIELHGGNIRVEFPSDGGTRFVVRLPNG